MELILLRHAAPAIDPGVCYGRSDIALLPGGEAPENLPAPPPRFTTLATSPLSRCRRLAEGIAAERGTVARVDPRLAEMDFGRWELRPWAEIPRAEIEAWTRDFDHARPHGGETVAEFRARVSAALAEVGEGPGPVLWVTHGGVVRAICAILGAHERWNTPLGFGQTLRVDI